ncbi:MAG: hypothetical protein PHE43_04055 [Candidatus Nanoarchaeia archaeon]|nr:hypothetical protein [Candidatus Nanoarchaeia archaeon]
MKKGTIRLTLLYIGSFFTFPIMYFLMWFSFLLILKMEIINIHSGEITLQLTLACWMFLGVIILFWLSELGTNLRSKIEFNEDYDTLISKLKLKIDTYFWVWAFGAVGMLFLYYTMFFTDLWKSILSILKNCFSV